MAGTLSTSTVNNVDIRAPHVGQFSKTIFVTAAGVTMSASVSIYVAHLPVGLYITDIKVGYSAGPATVTLDSLADGSTTYAAAATLTQSALNDFGTIGSVASIGKRVSISDDASPYYDTLKAIVSAGTATTTLAMVFQITGYMEPA